MRGLYAASSAPSRDRWVGASAIGTKGLYAAPYHWLFEISEWKLSLCVGLDAASSAPSRDRWVGLSANGTKGLYENRVISRGNLADEGLVTMCGLGCGVECTVSGSVGGVVR
jgi:hypothetical protein